jgi:hypothetical protein
MMKIKIPKPTPRTHYMLFCENTPFKQKVVKSKVKYQRNAKHKGAVE